MVGRGLPTVSLPRDVLPELSPGTCDEYQRESTSSWNGRTNGRMVDQSGRRDRTAGRYSSNKLLYYAIHRRLWGYLDSPNRRNTTIFRQSTSDVNKFVAIFNLIIRLRDRIGCSNGTGWNAAINYGDIICTNTINLACWTIAPWNCSFHGVRKCKSNYLFSSSSYKYVIKGDFITM